MLKLLKKLQTAHPGVALKFRHEAGPRGYISLLKFTEKGARATRTTVARAGRFRKAAEQCGVRVVGQYWTLEAYDGVLVLKADQENDALRCLTELASDGFVSTHTLPAFEANEITALLKR